MYLSLHWLSFTPHHYLPPLLAFLHSALEMTNQRAMLLLVPLALLMAVATAWTVPMPLQRPQVRTRGWIDC